MARDNSSQYLTDAVHQDNYSLDLLHRDAHSRIHIRHQLQVLKDIYQISGKMVIEVGCGLGENLEIFKPDNSVLGIEGLASAAEVARSRGLDVRQGDLDSRLEIDNETADYVLCLDVLEHLLRPMPLMVEMRRVLRAQGKAIVNVPNHFSLAGRVRLLFGHGMDVHDFFPDHQEWDNPHIRFYTYRGFTRLMEQSGFSIIEDRSCYQWAFPKKVLLERARLGPIMQRCATNFPALFAGGFFFVVGKAAPKV